MITGKFPDDVERLRKLKILILDGNRLEGIERFDQIVSNQIDWHHVDATGPLPGYVVNHMTSLEVLSVRNNMLTGILTCQNNRLQS